MKHDRVGALRSRYYMEINVPNFFTKISYKKQGNRMPNFIQFIYGKLLQAVSYSLNNICYNDPMELFE